MADVWISRKRWTCKYCDITINDDIPSRRQHENGLRHKGNVERALQQTYRQGERERKDAELAKREMDKIEKAALASYALDQAAGARSTSPPSQGKSKPAVEAKTTAWKPKDKFAAYSTAQSLGFQEDPEIKRRQQLEEERKQKGVAGEWETVASAPVPSASAFSSDRVAAAPPAQTSGFTSERQKARSFRLKEREAPTHDDDEDGMGEIKVKKRIKVESSQQVEQGEGSDQGRLMPEWTPIKLEKASAPLAPKEESPSAEPDKSPSAVEVAEIGSLPATADSNSVPTPVSASIKDEQATDDPTSAPTEPPGGGGGLFKKRRTGAGAGAKKVRALI